MLCQLAVVVLVCVDVRWSSAELYTAISDMEPLLETQKRIIDDLELFIKEDEERLRYIKETVAHYKEEHERAMMDIPNYLGNPLNAFTLIKRLTLDIDNMEKMIQRGAEMSKNTTLARQIGKYPALEDLTGAAEALMRLQDTYQLDVRELAQGKLNGVQYSKPLTSSDCFELGRGLYHAKDYSSTQLWMLEALRKYDEHDTDRVLRADILEYLAFSHYLYGDVTEALHWTEELVKEMPSHPRASGNIPHYKKQIKELEEQMKNQQDDSGDTESGAETGAERKTERGVYEALCRGEMDIPVHIAMRLKCFYQSKNDPFLRIAPFKVEQVYLSPDVFVFHDVMSDYEIEYIQEMARPRFQRATVHNPKTGELVAAQYRISKSSWLKDEESRIVEAVSRRVTHMTGLSMVSAEELQVVNYGIGGHYEPHFDFARRRFMLQNEEKHAFQHHMGNRIATVLFYMSDVAQGGATVFTELGLTMFPRRGTALYWLNLHPSGEGDFATRHAACPVLRGSKWVSNKWIHQGGQEFIKPCNLEYQREGVLRPIPPPVFKTNR